MAEEVVRESVVERGVIPTFFNGIAQELITTPIRQTPDGRLDLLDVCENVCNDRDSAKHRLKAVLNTIGLGPGAMSRLRWKGARGSSDSLVAMPNVALTVLLALRTRGGGELKVALATAFTRAMAHGDVEPPTKSTDRGVENGVADARAPVVGTAITSDQSGVIATLRANHTEQMQAQKDQHEEKLQTEKGQHEEKLQAQKEQHEELMRALTERLDRKSAQLTATFSTGNVSPPRSDDDGDTTDNKIVALEESLKRSADDVWCGFCLKRRPDVVMSPCSCTSACNECWDKHRMSKQGRKPRCPQCTNIVERWLRVAPQLKRARTEYKIPGLLLVKSDWARKRAMVAFAPDKQPSAETRAWATPLYQQASAAAPERSSGTDAQA